MYYKKTMKKKVLILIWILILCLGCFIGGYYTAILLREPVAEITEPTQPTDTEIENRLLLAYGDQYALVGNINTINKKGQVTVMALDIDAAAIFYDSPFDIITKTIVLNKNTPVFVSFTSTEEIETKTLANIDALKDGSRVVVKIGENIETILLEERNLIAQEIMMILSEDEYQNYLE